MAILSEIFDKYNIKYNSRQLKAFETYKEFLISENSKYNLTAIKTDEEIYYKHFIDSILPYQFFDENSSIVDIGTGAGFPSIPLAILRPNLQFVLIDSVEKKINFVNMLVDKIKLNNITTIHARCEDLAKQGGFRQQFDYCVSRAVAPLTSLLEYSVPFLKLNGSVIAYKGTNYNEELNNCSNTIKLLKISQVQTLKYSIPEINADRYCVIFKKNDTTPLKYPRSQNKVRLNPLN